MRSLTAKIAEYFTVATLSAAEQAELTKCVETVRRGLRSFVEAGQALLVIKTKQLYRANHPTFEAFAQVEFGLTARRLSQLIESFEVVENLKSLSPSSPAPVVEAQVRPLANMPAAKQAAIYAEAVQLAGGEAPAPKLVKEVAARHRPAKKGKKVARPVRLRVPGGTVVVEPNKAFTSVEDALVAALDQVRQAKSKAA